MEDKMDWKYCPSVKIMQGINDVTADYATKYPIENRYSSGISKSDEKKLHEILDVEIDYNNEKLMEIAEENIDVLSKIYDAFQLKEKYCCYGEDKKITKEKKAQFVMTFWDKYRTHFNREEERIICLNAFRRLQYKTQVMVNSASDDQRTRLLHSMEVERAARKIAVAVGANYELVSVIALAHDIGHAPFGHAGERAIDEFLSKNWMGRFAHALQGVKVLDKICSHPKLKEFGVEGVGLSKYVLEGVLKHDADAFVDDVSSPAFRLQYDCNELIKAVGCEIPKEASPKEIQIGSIESQIVAWADKIEYIGHDWEECIQFGLLDKIINRINSITIQMDAYTKDDFLSKIVDDKNKAEKKKEIELIKLTLNGINNSDEMFLVDNLNDWNKFYNEILSKILGYLELLLGKETKLLDEKELSVDDNHKLEPIKSTYFFSRDQYQYLFDFFNTVHAWVCLTKVYPKKTDMNFDMIYVFFDYLTKTTSHIITPKLTQRLVEDSKDRIKKAQEDAIKDAQSDKENGENLNEKIRTNVINKCNKKWKESSPSNNSIKLEKDAIRLSFLVTFSGENYEHIKTILDFIDSQYIKSTRVHNMTLKAEKIVNELLEFYCAHPEMLSYTFRTMLSQEIANEKLTGNTERILKEYFQDIIYSSKKEIRKEIEKILKDKFSYENHDETIRSDVVEKVITTRIVVDYVAGMTDRMAEMKYNEIVSSSTTWGTVYGD